MVETLFSHSLQSNSMRSDIINLLSVNWPQTTNGLHKNMREKLGSKVTYQAVHKTIKQLIDEGCILSHNKKYKINEEWIKDLGRTLKQIESNYQGNFQTSKTILNKEKRTFNAVIAKDGILRDEFREQELIKLLKDLIKIYRKEFSEHNIFQKPEGIILDYLLTIQKKHELFLILVEGKVVGGTVLEKKDESLMENHEVWKLKHFALDEEIGYKTQKGIFNEIVERLKSKSNSLKIQLNLSEKETRYIQLFKKHKFKKEGTLENHYRLGEKMYIYSLLVGN